MCVRAKRASVRERSLRSEELITQQRDANISIYRDVTKYTFLAKELFNLVDLPYAPLKILKLICITATLFYLRRPRE